MKILFIQNRVLFPANTGGRIRTLNVLRHLADWHDVTYLCNNQPEDEPHLPRMRELGVRLVTVPRQNLRWGSLGFYRAIARNSTSALPFNVAKHYDPAVRDLGENLLERERFDLVVCDFLQTALYAARMRGVPRVLFQHNVEAQILGRHAQTSTGGLRRRYLALQWRRMVRFEAETGRQFDAVIAVSDQDKRHFEREYGWRHVSAIDTGVDTDYFRPTGGADVAGRVLFLGSLDWLPNQEGVKHFVREIWPRVRQQHPGATFQVVGRNPSAEIAALGSAPGVEVVGTVPDVRPYLAAAAVVVVPLLVGGGTRLKIFEAMSMGKAVVSTTIGCEGLPVTAGEHLLVEDSADGFAAAVSGLLAGPARRESLGGASRALVGERYGSEPVARQFEAICEAAVRRGAGGAPTLSAEQTLSAPVG